MINRMEETPLEEQNRLLQIDEWKSEVRSVGSGLISFYFDGYEQAVRADNLELLNVDLIKKVLKYYLGCFYFCLKTCLKSDKK